MSKAVCRIGDFNKVFKGCKPDKAATGSPDTFVNGLPVHRKGDRWTVHACDHGNSYYAILQDGAPTTYANGLSIGRIDDPVIRYKKVKGSRPFQKGLTLVRTGSPDTFIGDGSSGLRQIRTFRAGNGLAGDLLTSRIDSRNLTRENEPFDP